MNEQLYHVFTSVDSFPYGGGDYKNVGINWLVNKRDEEPRCWRDHIIGYDALYNSNRFFTEDFLNKLFTESEKDRFMAYLDQFPGTHTSSPVKLPLEGSTVIGVGVMAVGGGTDVYRLNKHEDYQLPFEVLGYFDLRHCDPAITEDEAELSTDYLKQALSCLALEAPPDEHLRATAETLFDRGLYVNMRASWRCGGKFYSAKKSATRFEGEGDGAPPSLFAPDAPPHLFVPDDDYDLPF